MPKETLPKFYNVFCIKLKVKWKAHFQQALAAQTVFEKYGRKSKREQFLDEMNEVVPWARLLSLVEPHFPEGGQRPPSCWLENILRGTFCAAVVQPVGPGVEVNRHLATKGIRIHTGTIVDATIIHAPSSTKNSTGERDQMMHRPGRPTSGFSA